jgi:hypothetical protein
MAAVHAVVGAAAGHRAGRRRAALAAGVGSHLVGDLIPHRDYPLAIELPLMLATLAILACRYGVAGPTFWGALGGVLPDVENGLHQVGLMPESARLFPTHNGMLPHGRPIRSIANQLLLVLAALLVLRQGR